MPISDTQKLYMRVFGGVDGDAVMRDLRIRFQLDPNLIDDNTNRAFRAIGNAEVIDFIEDMINE